MNKRELLKLLENVPDDAEIWVSERGSCNECNPMGYDYYHEASFEYSLTYVNGYHDPQKLVVVL